MSAAPELIPNSFQCHNNYIDYYLAFLTAEEWKVLSYAIRRIVGFQKSQDRISISQFVSGLIKSDQVLDYGTGLSTEAVCSALSSLKKYGLIVEVAANDPTHNEGACYYLQFEQSKVDLIGLKERLEKKQAADRSRTEKARLAKLAKKTPSVGQNALCRTERGHSVGQNATPSVGQKDMYPEEKPRIRNVGLAPHDPKNNSPTKNKNSDIFTIFAYWKVAMSKRDDCKLVSGDKYWKCIEARLKEGFTVNDLKLAIDGCKADPFYMGRNDRNKKYNCLTLILRDKSKVESFIENAPQSIKPKVVERYIDPVEARIIAREQELAAQRAPKERRE